MQQMPAALNLAEHRFAGGNKGLLRAVRFTEERTKLSDMLQV